MGLPVLVATLFAKEHHMAVIMEPLQPWPQAAVAHLRQGSRVTNIVELGHPEIEHAVQRSKVSDTLPVRAYVHDGSSGIGEQQPARNECGRPVQSVPLHATGRSLRPGAAGAPYQATNTRGRGSNC